MRPVRRYLAGPVTEAAAGGVLRLAYVGAFTGQLLLATLVAVAVRLLARGVTPRPNAVLTWVLVLFAIVELVVASAMFVRLRDIKGRRPALTAALMLASLYGSVSWFLALALATGQSGLPLLLLLLLLSLAYALGFVATSRLAKAAAADTAEGATPAADAPDAGLSEPVRSARP